MTFLSEREFSRHWCQLHLPAINFRQMPCELHLCPVILAASTTISGTLERRWTFEQLPPCHSLSRRVSFYLHIALKCPTTPNPVCALASLSLELNVLCSLKTPRWRLLNKSLYAANSLALSWPRSENESRLYFPFLETLNNVRLSHEKWLFISKIDSIKSLPLYWRRQPSEIRLPCTGACVTNV